MVRPEVPVEVWEVPVVEAEPELEPEAEWEAVPLEITVEFPLTTMAVPLPLITPVELAVIVTMAAVPTAEVMLLPAALKEAELVTAGTKSDCTSEGRPVNQDGVDPAANSEAISE